jgi:hypothetical protein
MDTLSIYRDRNRNPDKTETKPIHQRGECERGEIGSGKKGIRQPMQPENNSANSKGPTKLATGFR